MASLTLKKDCKNYIACFTLPDGTRTNRSTGTTDKKLAQKLADEWEEASKDAAKGQFNEARARKVLNDILKRVGEDTLHSDTVESFLREWLKGKDNEGTNERYTHVVDLFLSHLGRKSQAFLTSITHKDVQGFVKSRQEAGLAPKTISVDVKTLSTAFNLAKRLGFMENNPVEKALALTPIKGESSERLPFTPEQVSALLRVATGEWLTVILFGYYTGARLEDCAGMRWNNIDFNENVVDFTARKSGVRAVIPMAPQLQAHLEKIATDTANPFITPELAKKESGGKSGLSEAFKKIMLAAGIDPQTVQGQGKRKFSRLSFHSLRHAFSSILANNGVDQETRMALIGQTTKAINTDYTHLDLRKLRGAMAKLPALDAAATAKA
jgi:integrase